jgi:hypothetical protein
MATQSIKPMVAILFLQISENNSPHAMVVAA